MNTRDHQQFYNHLCQHAIAIPVSLIRLSMAYMLPHPSRATP
jgi:hypothetical protein